MAALRMEEVKRVITLLMSAVSLFSSVTAMFQFNITVKSVEWQSMNCTSLLFTGLTQQFLQNYNMSTINWLEVDVTTPLAEWYNAPQVWSVPALKHFQALSPPEHCSGQCYFIFVGSGPGCISHSCPLGLPGTSCFSNLSLSTSPLSPITACRDSYTHRNEGLTNKSLHTNDI